LEGGRAVLIAYEIYRGPKNQYGKIPALPFLGAKPSECGGFSRGC